MRQNKLREPIAFCLGIALVAALVQLAAWLKGAPLVFPSVGEILRTFLRLLGEAETWRRVGTTLLHLVLSLVFAGAGGLLLGTAMGLSDFCRTLLSPLMQFLRATPMIVMAVIAMVLLPYDRVPLVVPSLLLIPLISEAVGEGIRRIDPELRDVWRLNSRFSARILLQVYLPLTAGYLRQAFANAAGMGMKLAVTTEYLVQTRDSLGKAIFSSSYFNDYPEVYAYALVMILLVMLLTGLPGLFRALLRRIRPPRS